MGLNTRYVSSPVLQSFFIDKDTALPLMGGIVSFFSDVNRTVPKPVFKISGTPPNYSYTSLGSVLTLSSVGTFVDGSGNDIVPYFYPYDANGNLELYYMTVVSAGSVPQFTREGLPNVADSGVTTQSIFNYIPNGQLLIHSDIAATATTVAGQITQAVTPLAQGGLFFVRPNTSTALDIITFQRYGAPVVNPTANPRYLLRVKTQTPDPADLFKDVRIRFNDVNKFASTDVTYTFSMTAQTFTGSTENVSINLLKNYGTGGSAETTVSLASFTIQPVMTIFNVPFIFGTNEGETIGTLDDDYVDIVIRYPTNVASDIGVVDFVLTVGDVVITGFPQTTNAEFLYQTIAGSTKIPAYNGHDLYLPMWLTPTGVEFSHADVGKVFSAVYPTPNIGELACDGASYLTSATSSDGIPYSRLQSVLFDNTLKFPRYGTGAANLSAYLADVSPASNLRISTNQPSGAITNAANGAISPGFTINTIHAAGNYSETAYMDDTSTFLVIGTVAGSVTAPTAGTSGFTVTDLINQTNRKHVFQVQTVAATGLAGDYFTFNTTTTLYAPWFTVNGSGSPPSVPGATLIQIDLLSTYTAAEVAKITREAISGYQQTTVITVAASTMTAGCYFTINTFTTNYVVYYTIDGVGANPNVPNTQAILVALLSTDTAAIVASKTQVAINSMWFATPPFNQGYFLRGLDPNSINSYDGANRFGLLSNLFGNQLGTFELDQIISHTHTPSRNSFAVLGLAPNTVSGGGGNLTNSTFALSSTGGDETRPVNAYVNYVIKY